MSDEEMAALKARVAELERAAKPPEPFTPDPYRKFDPTANMSMPQSTMQDMVNVGGTGVVREIAMRDGRAPTGPSSQGAIPSSQQVSNVRGSGWQAPIPLGPQPGIGLVDALCIADDVRQRTGKR
jgi:hypothetical protein